MGQALALLYFAGFTSLFFTLSILWQQGLGHSALATGLAGQALMLLCAFGLPRRLPSDSGAGDGQRQARTPAQTR